MNSEIKLNSVGFIPKFPKKASIAVECSEFSIKSLPDGQKVFSASAEQVYNSDTDENLWVADFSAVTRTGRFVLEVEGVGQSAEFEVADEVFTDPFRTVMLGMYLWRCGCPVSAVHNGVEYAHDTCHTGDGYTTFFNGEDVCKDGTGGWHDAGDYNKYVVNSGITVGLMLKAWEHFNLSIAQVELQNGQKGEIPAFLAEIKWNLDWVRKMQFPDGRVSHKMSAREFCGNIMPEYEEGKRFFVPWSTSATASFVAMMAQAARIYESFDPAFARECLDAARLSHDLISRESRNIFADQFAFHTGTYKTDDSDIRLWAAAEMWETTGEEKYLDAFEKRASGIPVKHQLAWYDVSNLGLLTYLTSHREGKDSQLVSQIQGSLITVSDDLLKNSFQHGYGRTLGDFYDWGVNGTVAGTVYILYTAYKATGFGKYLEAGHETLGYLLGRNSFGRSFVTGVGHNPPVNPHCRRSVASGKAWPGYLVGGPCENARDWHDESGSFKTNEIAINWNGAMVYALSAYLPDSF